MSGSTWTWNGGTLLSLTGVSVNDGTLLADGTAGSSYTLTIDGTTIGGTYQPGYAYNTGLVEADAGNTLNIAIGGTSELFNVGTIVADGGTVELMAASSAIAGGVAPVRGLFVIEGGGTLETNAAYGPDVSGGAHLFITFGDSTAGNTLKIDNSGSFGGLIVGFAAGDTIDLGQSLAISQLAYDPASAFLYLENSGGTVLTSLYMPGSFGSGTFAVSGGTADGFIIATGGDGDTVLTTDTINPVSSNESGSWQSGSLWSGGTVPAVASTPVIGEGASAPFTLITGGNPVSVAGLQIVSPLATLQITSDTTVSPSGVWLESGTIDVTGGQTLTADGFEMSRPQTALTIAATATLNLTGSAPPYLAPVNGVWSDQTGGTVAAVFSAGTVEVDGALLAGPPTAAGGGGQILIGYDTDGSASITVNSGGTVTDTATVLGSDPTSAGTLTLNGAGASWTDMRDAADPLDDRGYMTVGYDDLSANTPAGLPAPGPEAAAQVLVENGATLTEQARAYIGDSADSIGTVTVTSNGLWNIGYATGGYIDVGLSGTGALAVTNGGTVEVGNVGTFLSNGTTFTGGGIAVGYYAGASGSLSVDGGLLLDAGGISVGRGGQGTLDVLNGGTVDLTTAHGLGVGVSAGAAGTIVVSGTASVITLGTANTGIGVGEAGQGLLEIENGATVSNYSTSNGIGIGETAGANGTVVVTGTGALLLDDHGMDVGEAGQGTLEILSSGSLNITGNGIGIGVSAGAAGMVNVSGTASVVTLGTTTTGIGIGEAGQGSFEIQDGGTVSIQSTGYGVGVGEDIGSSGTVLVAGNDALLTFGTATGGIFVGDEGHATLDVNGGGTVFTSGDGLFAGLDTGGSGTVLVSGPGSAIYALGSPSGTIDNDGIGIGVSGFGSLDINSDGLVGAGTNFFNVGYIGGTGIVSVENGGALVDGNLGVGWTGGGLLDITSGGTVDTATGTAQIGENAGAAGTVVVDGGGSLLEGEGQLWVGYAGSGTLTVSDASELETTGAGTVGASGIFLGGVAGAVGMMTVESSGTVLSLGSGGGVGVGLGGSGSLDISSGGVVNVGTNFVGIGYNGATGVVSVENGGTLTDANVEVGYTGNGVLGIASGGTEDTTAGAISIGTSAGAIGTVTVSGAGALINSDAVIRVGEAGRGVLDVANDGSVVMTNASLGNLDLGGSGSGPDGGTGNVAVSNGGSIEDYASVNIWAGSSLSVDSTSGVDLGTDGAFVAGAIDIESGHSLMGAGLVDSAVVNNGQVIVSDAATLTASTGGTLEIAGPITGSGSITLGPSMSAMLDNSIAASQLIYFSNGDPQSLILGDPNTGFSNAIFNLYDGDSIELAGISITAAGVSSPGTVTVTEADSSTYQLTDVNFAAGSNQQFVVGHDSTTGDDFIQVTLCFLAGTHIATPTGNIPVERLKIGDTVLTHRGEARPITWIGEGRVLATRGRRTAATPVIVRKGALADNVPHRDLHVTKGHSFYLDGVLIPVEFLVNHRSILWDDHAQEVHLYHIELATHDVLLANGAPAESYRDDGNRWLFQNANSGWDQLPKPPCAPILTGGPIVDAVWRRLVERAGPRPGLPLTDDPDVHLLVDGRRVDATSHQGEAYIFPLPTQPRSVHVVSRSGVPAELGLVRDMRELGVAVRRIALRQGSRFCLVEAADPRLAEGFHDFEADNDFRWTDGDAALPVRLFADLDGPTELVLHVGCTTRYLMLGEPTRVAA